MIQPMKAATLDDVGRHYDELDKYYRQVWGEHVHHGLWRRGDESPFDAAVQLVHHLASELEIKPRQRICDIGCGYGATARLLANEYSAEVVGFTISAAQARYAAAQRTEDGRVEVLHRDWLVNGLDSESFDVAIGIESSEHFENKAAYFAEAFRVLRPSGRLGVYAWLAREGATKREVDWLLEPICREGRLPGVGTESEYRQLLVGAGFNDVTVEPLSRNVKRTWSICAKRLLYLALSDGEARRFAMSGPANRVFLKTVFRIWLAYALGTMHYGLFTARKPASSLETRRVHVSGNVTA